jgi:hypothetical protein
MRGESYKGQSSPEEYLNIFFKKSRIPLLMFVKNSAAFTENQIKPKSKPIKTIGV